MLTTLAIANYRSLLNLIVPLRGLNLITRKIKGAVPDIPSINNQNPSIGAASRPECR